MSSYWPLCRGLRALFLSIYILYILLWLLRLNWFYCWTAFDACVYLMLIDTWEYGLRMGEEYRGNLRQFLPTSCILFHSRQSANSYSSQLHLSNQHKIFSTVSLNNDMFGDAITHFSSTPHAMAAASCQPYCLPPPPAANYSASPSFCHLLLELLPAICIHVLVSSSFFSSSPFLPSLFSTFRLTLLGFPPDQPVAHFHFTTLLFFTSLVNS